MKRSEMVQIIMNKLYGSESMKSDEARASYILGGLEDAGMLPPKNKVGYEKTDYNRSEMYTVYPNTWEPETSDDK